jgi:hypothetical protein
MPRARDLLSEVTEEAAVGLNRDDPQSRFRQELLVKVGGIPTIVVIRLLVQPRPEWRGQEQPSTRS